MLQLFNNLELLNPIPIEGILSNYTLLEGTVTIESIPTYLARFPKPLRRPGMIICIVETTGTMSIESFKAFLKDEPRQWYTFVDDLDDEDFVVIDWGELALKSGTLLPEIQSIVNTYITTQEFITIINNTVSTVVDEYVTTQEFIDLTTTVVNNYTTTQEFITIINNIVNSAISNYFTTQEFNTFITNTVIEQINNYTTTQEFITIVEDITTTIVENYLTTNEFITVVNNIVNQYFIDNPVDVPEPDTITSETDNTTADGKHTHKLGNISFEHVVDGQPIEYGALYNNKAATNSKKISSYDNWDLPTVAQCDAAWTFMGGSGVISDKLRETGIIYWLAENGATNQYGLNIRGAGTRVFSTGAFSSFQTGSGFWKLGAYDVDSSYSWSINNTQELISNGVQNNKQGYSIRLVNPNTTLTNGQIGYYLGNDGKLYPTICINGIEWLSCNLNETKYRDGSWINGFNNGVYTPMSDVAWTALTIDGMCYYNDNIEYGKGQIALYTFLTYIQTKEPTIPYGTTDQYRRGDKTWQSLLTAIHNTVLTGLSTVSAMAITAADNILQAFGKLQAMINNLLINDIAFEFCDVVAGTAKEYTLDIKASYGYTIESACLETDNGTLTGVAVKIGTTAVTGLSNITVDITVDETNATAAKTVVAGNRVKLSISTGYTGTPTLIRGKLKILRI